jgi:putative transposase
MKYDPQKHHRRSIRLPEYDYSQAGAYFLTLCAWQRECLFGVISDEQIQLSPLGKIVQQEWYRSAQKRREIVLDEDEFVIMPNHLHGIVRIVDPVGADGIRPDDIRLDENRPDEPGPINGGASLAPLRAPGGATQPDGIHHTSLRRKGRSLGSFVAGFKAAVTARARRELDIEGVWQRNYYEHIIRNQEDYERIRDYIQTNPLCWADDQLHPAAPPDHFNQDRS